MYHAHYHLKSQPFSEHAPAVSLWIDDRMQEGLARLNHLVEHAPLGLVTGPSGVGKSALLKRFLHELSRQRHETVYCHLTHLNATGLLKMIISQPYFRRAYNRHCGAGDRAGGPGEVQPRRRGRNVGD